MTPLSPPLRIAILAFALTASACSDGGFSGARPLGTDTGASEGAGAAIPSAPQPVEPVEQARQVRPQPDASDPHAPSLANGNVGVGRAGDRTDGPGGAPVPEPLTLLLVGSGVAAASFCRRRRGPKVEVLPQGERDLGQ